MSSFLRSTVDVIGFLLLSLVAIVEALLRSLVPTRYKLKKISGEIALVTGGGGGLGRLLSLRLANLGAVVVVWDINEEGIDETVKLVRASGGTCHGYVCDLCNREDVYRKASLLAQEVGKVTILINNAGIVSGKRLMETPDQMIVRTMDVNVMSHFWTVKAFLPGMMAANKGHIVSIASLAGHVGIPKLVDYCASKFAAVGFDEALRMELEELGYDINTTVICPYFIRQTGMFETVQSRFVPTLSSNDVAERVITAMRCNEKFAVLPGYLRIMLAAKWLFPWACAAMFLRGLVPDANPEMPKAKQMKQSEKMIDSLPLKNQNSALHQQLTRHISSFEREP